MADDTRRSGKSLEMTAKDVLLNARRIASTGVPLGPNGPSSGGPPDQPQPPGGDDGPNKEPSSGPIQGLLGFLAACIGAGAAGALFTGVIWPGILGILFAAGLFLLAYFWTRIAPTLGTSFLKSINGLATNAWVWLIVAMLFLETIVLSPLVEQKRWPFGQPQATNGSQPDIKAASESNIADNQPKEMRTELANKNATISELNSQLAELTKKLSVLAHEKERERIEQGPSNPSPSLVAPPRNGPIQWDSVFSGWNGSDANGNPLFYGLLFRGVNSSGSAVTLVDAYAASDLTGEKKTLKVALGSDPQHLTTVQDINAIPPGAKIQLWLVFDHPLGANDLLEHWGKFEFILQYPDASFRQLFDEGKMDVYLSEFPGAGIGPHVTAKTGK